MTLRKCYKNIKKDIRFYNKDIMNRFKIRYKQI